MSRSKWGLIGVPDHQGVSNVGGRIGAALGPTEFRRSLKKLKGPSGPLDGFSDAGDVTPITEDVKANHERAIHSISKLHQGCEFTVVVGGGHDHGYSHLKGIQLATKAKRLGCINLDAHFDVRKPDPLISSGSPFFMALEEGLVHPKNLVEFGIQSQCNDRSLWEYIKKKKPHVVLFSEMREGKSILRFKQALKKIKSQCDQIVISLDLDCLASAFCPGVSSPQSEGFTPSEIFAMMEIAGAEKKCCSLGIFELNPNHDWNQMTARLAATAAFHFVMAKKL